MSAVHPISHAWISVGGTGAQNYDEFADEAEITTVIEANEHSALAVEMPHLAPNPNLSTFTEALPRAVQRLTHAKEQGRYRPADNVVAAYRIMASDGAVSLGLFAMVDTDQISTSADEPGLVIRNEDVFAAKVRERVALVEATRHLLSAVLLIQTESGVELAGLLAQICEAAPAPDVVDVDQAGRRHEVFVVTEVSMASRVCALAGAGELVVADGNHRSLAAQQAGLSQFLAVITVPEALSLQPYHRLLERWPDEVGAIDEALLAAGAQVEEISGPVTTPTAGGTIHVYAGGRQFAVRFPAAAQDLRAGVETMDHACVERVLIGDVLGWDPADSRVRYIGGDYPPAWLRQAVDDGKAAAAVLIAPVTVDDFVAVNVQRQAMPRKSTWFTPKVRAGLVLAQLG